MAKIDLQNRHMRQFPASALVLAFLAAVACSGEEGDKVPLQLQTIESTAEDAYDQALAGHRDVVVQDADTLETTWKDFRADAIRDGVTEADAQTLDVAISALKTSAAGSPDNVTLARAANGVSAPMSMLYAVYDPPVPAAVLDLDYLGREIELDGLANDLVSAAADVDALETTWKALRPQVASAGGQTQAAAFDASIVDERTAVNSADAMALSTAAHAQLDIVDTVEQVFSAADKPD